MTNKGMILARLKRYWDIITLGKLKWYLLGIFLLVFLSKVQYDTRFFPGSNVPYQYRGQYYFLYTFYKGNYPSYFYNHIHSLFIEHYKDWNELIWWNYIWVNSDFWRPMGLTLTGVLIFLLLVAYLRGQ